MKRCSVRLYIQLLVGGLMETLTMFGTQENDKENQDTTQYVLDTTIWKQKQIRK
jgi:hypothetical protein